MSVRVVNSKYELNAAMNDAVETIIVNGTMANDIRKIGRFPTMNKKSIDKIESVSKDVESGKMSMAGAAVSCAELVDIGVFILIITIALSIGITTVFNIIKNYHVTERKIKYSNDGFEYEEKSEPGDTVVLERK